MTIRGEQFANICLLRLFTGTSPLNISHKEPTATPLLQLVGRPVRVGLGLVEKKIASPPSKAKSVTATWMRRSRAERGEGIGRLQKEGGVWLHQPVASTCDLPTHTLTGEPPCWIVSPLLPWVRSKDIHFVHAQGSVTLLFLLAPPQASPFFISFILSPHGWFHATL